MGRAAPDLPDPLENADESAPSSGGADDLLSQLAGDEIDRLLAEADVEAAPPPQPAEAGASPAITPDAATAAESPAATEPAPIAESPTATAPALDAQLDELFNSLNEAPPANAAPPEAPTIPPPTPPVAPTSAPTTADLDDQLAKLANELLPTPEPVEAVTPVDPPSPAETAEALAEAPSHDAPAPAERAALLDHEPSADAPPAGLYDDAADEDDDAPLPWYLRPLLWLNAPFASLSDAARERVGKVALATLLFSVTILAFLAVTRHHP